MKVATKSKKTTIEYPFPITVDESVILAYSGCQIQKATLEANGILLSTVDIAKVPDLDPKAAIDIDFFGGKPFHGALAQHWKTKVSLYTTSKKVPSLVMKVDPNRVSWDDIDGYNYIENVSVGDKKDLKLLYTPIGGGYSRSHLTE